MLNREAIERFSEDTYHYASERFGYPAAEVHRAKICGLLNGVLLARLKCMGMEGRIVTYQGPEVDHHDFIELKGRLVVDADWQQFLDNSDKQLPKVLISKRSSLPDVLSKFGIPESKHRIWLTAA